MGLSVRDGTILSPTKPPGLLSNRGLFSSGPPMHRTVVALALTIAFATPVAAQNAPDFSEVRRILHEGMIREALARTPQEGGGHIGENVVDLLPDEMRKQGRCSSAGPGADFHHPNPVSGRQGFQIRGEHPFYDSVGGQRSG